MKKVLIVDDSKTLIKTLQKALKKYQTHFQPIYAHNGLEAMTLLDEQPFSLVVTDIQMPIVDGFMLLTFMRERYPNIPSIVMTAYGNDEVKELVNKEALHFFEKPINVNELAKTIIKALSRKKRKPKTFKKTLSEFLSLIVTDKKTCIFKVISNEGSPGFYYFYKGDLYNAVCGNLKGDEAVQKMIELESAKIVFTKPPKQKGTKNVNIDVNKLIQIAKSSELNVEMTIPDSN